MRTYHVPSCTCYQCLSEKAGEPLSVRSDKDPRTFCETCNMEVSPICEGGIAGDGEPKWVDKCPLCGSILNED